MEWRIQSKATSRRCFIPEFPISERKTPLENTNDYVETVQNKLCCKSRHPTHREYFTVWAPPVLVILKAPSRLWCLNSIQFSFWSARLLMLCSKFRPVSHVPARRQTIHTTSAKVHTCNISSEKWGSVESVAQKQVY